MNRRACIVRQAHGYELPLRREAEALRDAGFDVTVVALRGRGEPGREHVDGVEIRRLPLTRRRAGRLRYLWDYSSFFLWASVMVAWMHLRRRFTLVQVNTMPDLLVFVGLVPRLTGARLVAFMKEPTPELGDTLYGSRRVTRALETVERWAIKSADLVFTVTDDLKERLVARGADPAKIHVVLNVPDPRSLELRVPAPAHDRSTFTAICHGSIEERYGHDTIVRAAALVREEISGFRVRILGRGEHVPEVVGLIDELGLVDVVQYVGWLPHDDMLRELHAADVGIVAQKSSPYSNLVHTNKMFEYMLVGKPAIVSRLAAVSRTVPDDTIQYFEPDDPRDLADALVKLHRDPGRVAELVANGTRFSRDLGWDRQRAVYLDAIHRLLAVQPPG